MDMLVDISVLDLFHYMFTFLFIYGNGIKNVMLPMVTCYDVRKVKFLMVRCGRGNK